MLETKITEMLGQLSEKLGVASAKIWEWSMLQVQVEIIQTIMFFLLSIGCTFAVTKYGFWIKKNWDEIYHKDHEGFHVINCCVIAAFVFVMNISVVVEIFDLPMLIINPEYAAFQNIIGELAKLK